MIININNINQFILTVKHVDEILNSVHKIKNSLKKKNFHLPKIVKNVEIRKKCNKHKKMKMKMKLKMKMMIIKKMKMKIKMMMIKKMMNINKLNQNILSVKDVDKFLNLVYKIKNSLKKYNFNLPKIVKVVEIRKKCNKHKINKNKIQKIKMKMKMKKKMKIKMKIKMMKMKMIININNLSQNLLFVKDVEQFLNIVYKIKKSMRKKNFNLQEIVKVVEIRKK